MSYTFLSGLAAVYTGGEAGTSRKPGQWWGTNPVPPTPKEPESDVRHTGSDNGS